MFYWLMSSLSMFFSWYCFKEGEYAAMAIPLTFAVLFQLTNIADAIRERN